MKAATFLACLAMSFSSCPLPAAAKDVTGRIPEAEDFNTGNSKEYYDRIPKSENVNSHPSKELQQQVPESESNVSKASKEFYDRIPESENVSPTHFKEFYDRIWEQSGGDMGAGSTDDLPGDGMDDSGPGAEYQMQPAEDQ